MKLVADLDDTLAPLRSRRCHPKMDMALRSLLDHVEVCIISGGQGSSTQVLDSLNADELSRLHLMPFLRHSLLPLRGRAVGQRYAHDLGRRWPPASSNPWSAMPASGLWEEENPWGSIIETVALRSPSRHSGGRRPSTQRAWDG